MRPMCWSAAATDVGGMGWTATRRNDAGVLIRGVAVVIRERKELPNV